MKSIVRKYTVHGAATLLACALALVVAGNAVANTMDVWREATLYRDEWGTPYVYAETPFSMAYVFGYAQAEDHAEHLLLAYRMANGRLAAVLGEAWADSDAFSLKMGHARLAEQALYAADPLTRALCEGFAMGVNAWLVDHPEATPSWADGVQPQDILAYWHAFLMSMAPFDLPDLYRRAPAMSTGNAWALAAERGVEGRPTLVINPHQNHQGFFQWYEARLVMGDMNIHGATLRGLPVILQGHNDVLGWALTPNWPDFADMFLEEYEAPQRNPRDPRVRPDDGLQEQAMLLHYMSHSVPYNVRTDTGVETRYVPAYISDRGPIFEDSAHGLNSWYIGGFTDFGGLVQLVQMARAQHLEAFWAALSLHQLPCFNVVYADRDNNIFYLYNAKAGVRFASSLNAPASFDSSDVQQQWDVPVSSSLSAVTWRSVFSLAELPTILNPDSGYIQACGSTPWTATVPSPLTPEMWPSWLFHDQESYRAARVRQLLRRGERSFRDHQSMLFDIVVPAALDMVPALLRAVEMRPDRTANAHPDFWEGVDLLRNWNYVAETNAPGMTFYHLWWNYARARASQHFQTEAFFYEAAQANAPLAQDAMLRAVEEAARELRNEYGALHIPWGDVHRLRRGRRDEALPGAQSGDPIFLTGEYTAERGKLIANYGYGFAMVVQFGEQPESVSLLPFGASQRPDTPHYADQFDLMLERRFKRVRFDHDDALRNADRAVGKSVTLLPLGVPGAVTLHSSNVMHARLHTQTEAPAPLPREAIPFSLYIEVERSPAGIPIHTELSIHIPRALCDDAAFHDILIYRYEPGLSWHPVPMQNADARTRIIHAHDGVLARWYAALGPADAAGAERYADYAPVADTLSHGSGLVGLDALLSHHDAQVSVTAPDRRTFHLERHDAGDGSREEQQETVPVPTVEPGRTFRLDRLDQEAAEETVSSRESPLLNIPGMHFGPATRASEERDDQEDDRVFHIERHDQDGEEGPPADVAAQDKRAAAEDERAAAETDDPSALPEPPRDASPDEISVPVASAPEEAPPPYDSPSEEPAPAQDKRPIQEELDRQQQRPPLPDVIPQDPAFVFGPARTERQTTPRPESSERVFHIERLDSNTTEE